MSITSNYTNVSASIPSHVTLVVVTKKHPIPALQEVYDAGARVFGENKVQELLEKHPLLPSDIEWHLIGHLQSNKVKQIAPFITMIHSVDSFKLLTEINKQALKNNRVIPCLLQIHIAEEDSKFGLSFSEAKMILASEELKELKNITIKGVMGMATNTNNEDQIAYEFQSLDLFFEQHRHISTPNINLDVLSMGMSSDYPLAIENGSTMVRVGSSIFGQRQQ